MVVALEKDSEKEGWWPVCVFEVNLGLRVFKKEKKTGVAGQGEAG